MGAKTSQENSQKPTSVALAGPLILHDDARPHIAVVVTKNLGDYGWEVLPHAPYSLDMSPPVFDLFPKLKEPMHRGRFSSLKGFLLAVPELFDT